MYRIRGKELPKIEPREEEADEYYRRYKYRERFAEEYAPKKLKELEEKEKSK